MENQKEIPSSCAKENQKAIQYLIKKSLEHSLNFFFRVVRRDDPLLKLSRLKGNNVRRSLAVNGDEILSTQQSPCS